MSKTERTDIASVSSAEQRLASTLLLRAAEREGTAARSTLLGVALVAYAHWEGVGHAFVPYFVAARLLALAYAHLVSQQIIRLHARGEPYMHLEWQFVLGMGAGGAAWGIISWMVPDLNLAAWEARDIFSAVILIFISCITLITLAHHRNAMLAHLCAQWAVACSYMVFGPGPLTKSLLILVGIGVLLTVLLLYGRLLWTQTRQGVLAELRNEDLTQELRGINQQLELTLQQAETAANHDALTGLLNRRALYAQVKDLAPTRQDKRWSGAVLLVDVDHFKRINDGYGHAVGDAVLRALAETLSGALRKGDVVARWGGEEFIVLMPACEINVALVRAEALRAAVAALKVPELPPDHTLGVSIGVADWSPNAELDAVVNRSDAALYKAKAAGRNRVLLAD